MKLTINRIRLLEDALLSAQNNAELVEPLVELRDHQRRVHNGDILVEAGAEAELLRVLAEYEAGPGLPPCDGFLGGCTWRG